jgi:hypothetical protein
MRLGLSLLLAVGLVGLSSSCSHVQTASGLASKIKPDELLAQVCSIGKDVGEVKGVVLMKVKSREASGQLSGDVHAKAPSSVELEVLQPMGGVWATIRVQCSDYAITVEGKPEQSRKGRYVWAGIPLRFATELFLGRIPCAAVGKAGAGSVPVHAVIDSDNELVVDAPGEHGSEKFIYRFREDPSAGRLVFWPESLHWVSAPGSRSEVSVDFKFDEPEKNTRSPLRWEAHSVGGEIKIHWRSREHS